MLLPRSRFPALRGPASFLWLLLLFPLANVTAQEGGSGTNSHYRQASLTLDGFGETNFTSGSDSEIESWVESTLAPQLGLGPSDSLTLAPDSKTLSGFTIRSLQQTHQGLDVVGFESRLVVDRAGQVQTLLGKHTPFSADGNPVAVVSREQAQQLAGMIEIRNAVTEPVFLPLENGELRLSWEFTGSRNDAGILAIERVYVDASTGEILKRIPLVYTAMHRKVIDMELLCQRMGINYVMDFATLADVTTIGETESQYYRIEGDGPRGVDHVDTVFELLGDAYHFISTVLGRDSLDDNGVTLEAFSGARYNYDSGLPQCYGDVFNASWFGGGWDEMYIPEIALPYIEILFHEATHGIIDFNGNGGLVYENQSGALNEAISDVAGVTFRAWVQSGGRLGVSPARINSFPGMWELRAPGEILRNLQFPQEQGNPDHFGDINRLPPGQVADGSNDSGFVHSNSSIINQAFYVLVEGGQHPRLRIGPVVQGIGIEQAIRIYIEAATKLLTPYADFQDARNGFAQAAELLHGRGSPQWIAVHESMDVVGIPGFWEIPPEPIPLPEPEPEPETEPGPDPAPEPRPDPQAPPIIPDTTSESDLTAYLYLIPVLLAIGLALLAAMKLRPQYADTNNGGGYNRNVPGYHDHSSPASPVRDSRPAFSPQGHAKIGEIIALDDNIHMPLVRHLLESREGMVIGRVATLSHIVLEDSHVSRRHARLRFANGGLTVEDLNSSHGTSVDGQQIRPFDEKQITSGQLLRIAGISFKVVLG